MLLAKKTGHFQVFRLSQGNGRLAMRAGNFLAEVLDGELDMSTALVAGDF